MALLAAANRPTLQDILGNTAPPPWTLGAFMAYLSQNHCLETLEFTMEAERYRAAHAQALAGDSSCWVKEASERLCSLWQKLINAYILPCGPREVNIPAPVRDRLLELRVCSTSPPNPSELDEAVRIVFELMNDSVLLPFLESTSHAGQAEQMMIDDEQDARQGRGRLRSSKDASSAAAADEQSGSPKMSFLPQLSIGRRSEGQSRSGSSSSEAADGEEMTDDSSSSALATAEPLTPPTTPPTSDWTFSGAPAGLQRAISARSAGWKRMSAKLGLSRKGRASHRANTPGVPPPSSVPYDGDIAMPDTASLCPSTSSAGSPL